MAIKKKPVKKSTPSRFLGERWAYRLKNGRFAYDDQDATVPKVFKTLRAAKTWDESKAIIQAGGVLIKVEVGVREL